MPEDPAISVLSRSKNAAARGGPAPLLPSLPCATSDPDRRSARSSGFPSGALDLEDHRVALPTAGADRSTAKASAAPAQLEHEAAENARPGCADRVPQAAAPPLTLTPSSPML